MSDLLESASAHLQKAVEHLEVAKVQYESAKATYQSAKALYETIEASQSRLVKSGAFSSLCQSCAAVPLQLFSNRIRHPNRSVEKSEISFMLLMNNHPASFASFYSRLSRSETRSTLNACTPP